MCQLCPAVSGTRYEVRLIPLFIAVGVSLFLFVSLLVLLHRLFKVHHVPITFARLIKIPFDYVFWLLIAFQLLAQAGRSSAPGAPAELRRIFDVIQLVQLDFGGVAPPQCEDGPPFARFIVVFTGALTLFTAWALLVVSRTVVSRRCSKRRHLISCLSLFRYSLLMLLLVSYPLVLNLGVTVMECSTITLQDESISFTWDFNPYYRCFEGNHILPFILALTSWIIIGLVLPFILLMTSRNLARKMTSMIESAEDGKVGIQPGPVHRAGTQRNRCGCPPWCHLLPPVHAALRKHRAWVPVFGFGQPWFRTAYLYLFLWLAFLQWLPDTTLVQQLVNGGAQMLSLLGFAVAVALLRPDHEWGTWRRWPRFATSVASACVVGMRMSFLWDAAQRDAAAQDSAAASGNVEPISAAVASPQPSLLSTVLVWAVLCLIVALPLVQLTSFLVWLNGLVPLRQACCSPCRTRIGHVAKSDKSVNDGRVGINRITSSVEHSMLFQYLYDDTAGQSPRLSFTDGRRSDDGQAGEEAEVVFPRSMLNPLYGKPHIVQRDQAVEMTSLIPRVDPASASKQERGLSVAETITLEVSSEEEEDGIVVQENPLILLGKWPSRLDHRGRRSGTHQTSPIRRSRTHSRSSKARLTVFRSLPRRSKARASVAARGIDEEAYASALMAPQAQRSRYVKQYAKAAAAAVAKGYRRRHSSMRRRSTRRSQSRRSMFPTSAAHIAALDPFNTTRIPSNSQ